MSRSAKPRIAVILDENTSGGGRRNEASKGYFEGIANAGGLPFGVPYLAEMVDVVLSDFDGVLSVGGRFSYPSHWNYGDSALNRLHRAFSRFIECTVTVILGPRPSRQA